MKLAKNLSFLLIIFSLVFIYGFSFKNSLYAKTAQEIQEEIKKYEQEISRLANQAKTLSGQIAQFDAQIKLTTLKINQTEEKILLLGGRIDQLEVSLDALAKAFSSRAVETYKIARVGSSFLFLITSGDLTEAISRFHYLQKIQEADRALLEKLQRAQTLYKEEKQDQESLQKQLEEQKKQLAAQKAAKAQLLAVTKNDEKKYQQLLEAARAELAVILGQGKETFLRNVSEGEVIGRVIPSASGCSSGQHLHFEVHQGGSIQDPNNFLKPISFRYASGYDTGYYGAINPHGSWNWPMLEPIQINQGFGSHPFARTFYPGGVHNGIDLDSNSSTEVRAVKPGKLYGGAYQCGGRYPGTLFYAKVEQSDGITSWYLHMTPS